MNFSIDNSRYISDQVETQYNTPPTEQEVCQFDLSVSTIERVRRFYDQPILVVPKPTKAPKKRKPKAKGRRNKKCRRKNGRRCKRCRGRRCNTRRNKPKPTTPARPVSTRALPNDAPAPNSVSIKICARYVGNRMLAFLGIKPATLVASLMTELQTHSHKQTNKLTVVKTYNLPGISGFGFKFHSRYR